MKPTLDSTRRFSHQDLLASAVAGRSLRVCIAQDGARFSYTAGQSIMVPRHDRADDLPALLGVVAQAMLVAVGSLEPAVLRLLIGQPEAARRYAFLEVSRAMQVNGAIIPVAFYEMLGPLAKLTVTHSARDSARIALKGSPSFDIPQFVGTVRPLKALRAMSLQDPLAMPTGRMRTSRAVPQQDEQSEQADEIPRQTSVLLKLLQNPLSGGNPFSDLLDGLIGATRPAARGNPQEDAGAELAIGRMERGWRQGLHAIRTRIAILLPERATEPGSATDLRFPEWDAQRGRLRQDWVQLSEVDAWRADGPRDLSSVLARPPITLLRQLAPLGLRHAMQRGQSEGSDLDVGRLAEYAIRLRLGEAEAAPDIYRASRRIRRELGVVVMLDLSASTGERNPAGQSVFEQHLRVGCNLVECFDRLGCSVGFHGFHSWGRHEFRAVRLKSHREGWSGRVAERCALLEPVGFTRTGAAVRYGDFQLRQEMRLPKRLLILISDGFPYDQGYEGSYAEADTRMALSQARSEQTACLCICVGGSSSSEFLGKVFGGSNFLAVERPEQVSALIAGICRHALAKERRPRMP